MSILFNILIFLLPLGVVFRISPIANVSVYPHDVIVGFIFFAFLFQIVIRKAKIKERKLFIIFSAFLLIGFVSLLINFQYLILQQFLISFAYLLRYAAYVSIIFAFQFLDQKFKESVSNKLLISGTFFLLFGLVQYLFYPNLRNLYYLGWDEHLYRLFSTFLDPNFAGAYLVLFLILITENIFRNKTHLIPLWVVTLLAIILTYSRSAFIMLIVGISILLILRKKIKILAFLIILFVGLFFAFANKNFEGLNPFRIASSEARIESANVAISIFSNNPVLGVGFNAYRYAQIRYGFRMESSAFINNADAGTDNSYLFVLATTGILGFLAFLLFWSNIIKSVYKESGPNPYRFIALASMGGLAVNTIFINSLFYPSIMTWLFILIGITVSRRQ